MYSIITKIAHSVEIKDAIAMARGLYRVVTAIQPKYGPEQIDSSGLSTNLSHPIHKDETTIKILQETVDQRVQHITKNSKIQQKISQIPINSPSAFNEPANYLKDEKNQQKQQKQSKVISGRFGRFFEYAKIGKQMLEIEVEAYVARNLGKGNEQQIYERGAHKITEQLCKMRGAPLKVAQILSIQEDNLIPSPIRKAFQKAREHAHIMPDQQVNNALKQYLGQNWKSRFSTFDMKPFAAASIGQVHRATSLQQKQLAVKLQYPGVQKSIQSDIKNIKMLLKLPGVLPKGIFLDKLLANTQKQLTEQCDYIRQAKMQSLYDKCLKEVMKNEYQRLGVPQIFTGLSSKGVLTSQFLKGVGIGRFQQEYVPQLVRDEVGRLIMKLTFSEIFQMGIMQSDPNPSNFTYNIEQKRLNLFDFGATHIYDKTFLANYCQIINASIKEDRESIIENSVLAGFLTKEENTVMLNKHVESIMHLGEPLRWKGLYDFGSQKITQKIYKTIPQMLKNRLKAPPEQIYSLHRKLSGAYLACIRMRARVDCNKIYEQLNPGYRVEMLI